MKGQPKSKKQPAKKTQPVKKPAAAQKKSEHSMEKKELLKKLKGLAEDINEEGLIFLIKQAHILLHNMKVEQVNAEIMELESARTKNRGKPIDPDAHKHDMDIIESADGSSFIFAINKDRKIFSIEEMRKLVKLCHSSKDGKDASGRLYNWFEKNRGDVLYDVSIKSPRDPALATIYNQIINNYKLKE